MTAVLHEGVLRQNGMPQFAELTADEIDSLQHYIRQQTRVAIAAERARPH